MKKKWYSINGAKAALHDGIGQGDVQTVDAFLAELPAEGAIELAIDSNGGSVAAGLRIYTALKDRDVTATVTGMAASMASVVLMAASKRIGVPGALVFVHDPTTAANGDAEELRKAAAQLDAMANGLAGIYALGTGKDLATVQGWMSADTLFSASQALDAGLFTEVAGEAMAAEVDPKRLPDAVAQQIVDARAAAARAALVAECRAEVEAIIRAQCAGEYATLAEDVARKHTDALAALTAEHTAALAKVKAERDTKITAANAKAESLEAALTAATSKLKALAAGAFHAPEGESQDSAEAFWAAVAGYQGEGMSRNDSISRAARDNPAAHKAMIAAANRQKRKD